jgi:membrane protein DedA with SNARE-associated domain
MDSLVDWVVQLPPALLWSALVVGTFVEYVVPPIPGDLVMLAGSVIGGTQGIGFLPCFAATTAGSVAGAWLDYEVGRWLARPGDGFLHRWAARPRVARVLDKVARGFERHGDLYLLVNRFLPGVRAFFFVAAGYAAYPRRRTLIVAAIGAMLWNAVILAVGWQIGANLDELVAFSERYTKVAWVVLGVIGATAVAVTWLRVRAAKKRSGGDPPSGDPT